MWRVSTWFRIKAPRDQAFLMPSLPGILLETSCMEIRPPPCISPRFLFLAHCTFAVLNWQSVLPVTKLNYTEIGYKVVAPTAVGTVALGLTSSVAQCIMLRCGTLLRGWFCQLTPALGCTGNLLMFLYGNGKTSVDFRVT